MEFIEFIKLIEYRPEMYLGIEDLNLLRQYINGFIFCYEMNCKKNTLLLTDIKNILVIMFKNNYHKMKNIK